MTDNMDNENTVVFNSGNDNTRLYSPPGQPQEQFARPVQPVNGGTQMFVPPTQQQQEQFARPVQPVNGGTQMFVPPTQQQQEQFARPVQPQPYQQAPPQYQQAPQYQQDQIFGEQPKKKSKASLIIVLVVMIAVLAALIVGLIMLLGKDDDDTGKKSSEVYSSSETNEYKSAADSIWKGTQSALSEWKTEGRDVRKALITSDRHSEKYDGDGTADDLRAKIMEYCPDLEKYEYVLVIEDGNCTGAAASDGLSSRKVGTYSNGADMSGKTLTEIITSISDSLGEFIKKEEDDGKVTVPNVVGMTKTEALEKLGEGEFEIVVDGKYSDDYAEDTVIEQSLKSNTRTDKGTSITITVSLGKELKADEAEVPNVLNINYELAKEQLEANGFVVEIAYSADGAAEKDTVVAQSIPPNTMAAKGATIVISVATGSSGTPQPTAATGVVVTEATELNVRSGPSMNDDIIGTVAKDSTVTIIGQTGSGDDVWYQIEYGGGYGYVAGDFIAVQ